MRNTTGASKRRWKARCRMGLPVTRHAIEEYRLTRWFNFVSVSDLAHLYVAVARRP